MRQFYDESRVYRITGDRASRSMCGSPGQMLQPQPVDMIGGVELGSHEPVFDITVIGGQEEHLQPPFSERDGERVLPDGLLCPANADAALAVLI